MTRIDDISSTHLIKLIMAYTRVERSLVSLINN